MDARGYTGRSSVEAAHEFCQAYQMCHPRRTVLFLCASDERIGYHESDLVKSARESAEKLFDSSVHWIADPFRGKWLASGSRKHARQAAGLPAFVPVH